MSFWSARAVAGAFILGLCAAAAAVPSPVAAAEKEAVVPAVIVVDLPQVLRSSKAGKGVQQALSEESQNYSKEVSRQEDELQRMRGDLERQRTVLSSSAYEAKAKAFQLHLKELDTAVQAKRQALQKAYYEAMSKIEAATRDIIGSVAKERGANLVLLKQAVVLSPDSADVTTEVLARLDKNLSSVPINVPKTEPVTRHRTSQKSKSQSQSPQQQEQPQQLPNLQLQPQQ